MGEILSANFTDKEFQQSINVLQNACQHDDNTVGQTAHYVGAVAHHDKCGPYRAQAIDALLTALETTGCDNERSYSTAFVITRLGSLKAVEAIGPLFESAYDVDVKTETQRLAFNAMHEIRHQPLPPKDQIYEVKCPFPPNSPQGQRWRAQTPSLAD